MYGFGEEWDQRFLYRHDRAAPEKPNCHIHIPLLTEPQRTKGYLPADLETNVTDNIITLHIHESLDMCRKVKNQMLCVGKVNFGDVVYTLP